MEMLKFPTPFKHEHPAVRNVSKLFEEGRKLGQRAADRVAIVMGSWQFIIIQSLFLMGWAALNVTAWVKHWDPYPFILMNLFLSLQAAYTAPVIMMSQNEQARRDRIAAEHDYFINEKAEVEIRAVLDHLAAQDRALEHIHTLLANVVGAKGKTG